MLALDDSVGKDATSASTVNEKRPDLPAVSYVFVETVTCYQLTSEHAERAAEIWARRWVDANA